MMRLRQPEALIKIRTIALTASKPRVVVIVARADALRLASPLGGV
jgi:hypothetical protein